MLKLDFAKATSVMPKLIIDGKELDVSPGITILDAALDHNIEINHNCGGNCACSTCQVIVEQGMENLSAMREDESDMLEDAPGRIPQTRLACQAQVMGKVSIKTPPKLKL